MRPGPGRCMHRPAGARMRAPDLEVDHDPDGSGESVPAPAQ